MEFSSRVQFTAFEGLITDLLIYKTFQLFFFVSFMKAPPMKSCKDVQKKCPECLSGFYFLEFPEPTKVFCDLETDNGKRFFPLYSKCEYC